MTPHTHRVLVTGGRNLRDRELVTETLDAIHAETDSSISAVIHGYCIQGNRLSGADLFADAWARSHGIPVEAHPADWDNIDAPGAVIRINRARKPYNVKAGFQRNAEMLRSCPTLVLGFPDPECPRGSPGTSDMLARARQAARGGAALEVRCITRMAAEIRDWAGRVALEKRTRCA